jgi:hypothetical protein
MFLYCSYFASVLRFGWNEECIMSSIIRLPFAEPSGPSIAEDHQQTLNSPGLIPRGLIEWVSGTERLNREQHQFTPKDITRVEAYWSFSEGGFSSSGFIVKLHDGRRFHLQCGIDEDNQPDMVAISAKEIPIGKLLPEFGNDIEPLGGWSKEVDTFNIDLARFKTSNIP